MTLRNQFRKLDNPTIIPQLFWLLLQKCRFHNFPFDFLNNLCYFGKKGEVAEMKYSCCLETVFVGEKLDAAARAAAACGITTVEFWHLPEDPQPLCKAIAQEELRVGCFLANRGASPLDADSGVFFSQLQRALQYAPRLGCQHLIVCLDHPDYPHGTAIPEEVWKRMIENLRRAALMARQQEITLLLEPLNTRYDHPNATLDSTDMACKILAQVNLPSLRMLYDIYHRQFSGGDLTHDLLEKLPWIGYLHIAGVPERDEPYLGEVNYPVLLHRLEQHGYDGFVGFEFFCRTDAPETAVEKTVRWLHRAK